jgi:transcription antitermination factor NusG
MAEACSPPLTAARSWFAVRLRSNQECRVAERLEARGIYAWNPTFLEQSQWSDRKKTIARPFFPGYVFVLSADTAEIAQTPGVVQILPTSLNPCSIPDDEIGNLKRALESRQLSSLHAYVVGDKAAVTGGPFAGHEGLVMRTKTNSILLEILHHAVEISTANLKKAA